MIKYSLIIPCFNESGNIQALVRACKSINLSSLEFIYVNNGSTDSTLDELNLESKSHLNSNVISSSSNLGYGGGIKLGLSKAKGEFIGWTHADLQTNPRDLIQIINWIEAQSSLESDYFFKGRRKGRGLADRLFTTGMSIFESLLFSCFMEDINAQPTFFPAQLFIKYADRAPDDFSLDLFFYVMAKKESYILKRFPVNFLRRSFGSSSWNTGFKSRLVFIRRTISFSIKLKKSLKNDNN
jgi:polyisoprenyl-phosphate glycosyltransferase